MRVLRRRVIFSSGKRRRSSMVIERSSKVCATCMPRFTSHANATGPKTLKARGSKSSPTVRMTDSTATVAGVQDAAHFLVVPAIIALEKAVGLVDQQRRLVHLDQAKQCRGGDVLRAERLCAPSA